MADSFTKEQRSEIMRKVKSKNNKSTELKIIQIFKENRITGWRRNFKLIGKPDIVFRKERLAIFLDGCFWHGHNCRNTKPKDNADYWNTKIQRNKERDIKISEQLRLKNWKVLRIWECQLKDSNKTFEILQQYLMSEIDKKLAFKESFAAFESKKSAEEIIEEIRNARISTRKIEDL